ncbi:MAG: aspartyl protease family protein [Bacteroidota bacterium]
MRKIKIASSILLFLLTLTCFSQTKKEIFTQGTVTQKHFSKEIPFKYIKRHIFIEVVINSKKYDFLFDTAYSLSAIDKSIISDVDHKKISSDEVTGSAIKKPSNLTIIDLSKISIDSIDFHSTSALIQDLSFIQKNYSELTIAGVVGNNLLRKLNWQIDYKNKTIKMSDSEESMPVQPSALVLKLSGNTYGNAYISSVIDDRKIDFLFDLGSSGKFTLNNKLLSKFTKKDQSRFKVEKNKTEYLSDEIQLDKLKFTNETITFEEGVSNLLGNMFFENYVVSIFWNKNEIWLTPM